MLRNPPTLSPLTQRNINRIHQSRSSLTRKRHPQAERNIVQSRYSGGLAVCALVDRGEGGKDEVNGAVDKGHVDAEELDDGFADEEGEGADDGFCEEVAPAERRK